MHVTLMPAGTRGDVQPLLAAALALGAAGHRVRLLLSPDFLGEARAFGLSAEPLGFDVQGRLREGGYEAHPVWGALQMFGVLRGELERLIPQGLALARGTDLVVGAGAQLGAATVADALGVPYVYVAYSPQLLRSSHHPPLTLPLLGLPRPLNRALWGGLDATAQLFFHAPLGRARAALGLPPVPSLAGHLFPPARTLLAADPALTPPPPDAPLAAPPLGALELPDGRPLPPLLECFLEAGPAPVYAGFGSMPDLRAGATTALLVEGARRAGRRLVLSGGWARLGGVAEGAVALAEDVLAVGPVSHPLLFPRVAAVVHHGGAGTTHAAARAGRPQLVVPHLMDQFLTAAAVARAGVGAVLPRRRLDPARLAAALGPLLDPAGPLVARAAALGQEVRARASGPALVRALEALLTAARPA